MRMQKEVTTTREFEATEIPSGMKIRIPEGTPLAITQSLGGSYTVLTPYGYMARVDGSDADAIGEEIASPDGAASGKSPGELAWDQLRTCYDPEIPVNIVDLGLVYKCEVVPRPEGGPRRRELHTDGAGLRDGRRLEGRHPQEAPRRRWDRRRGRAGAVRSALEHEHDVRRGEAAAGDDVRGSVRRRANGERRDR